MSWLRALKETARSGFTIERQRLEPFVALRGAVGLAVVVGVCLTLFGATVAVSAAFGAFQAGIATLQRSWRPRPTLALASGASLAVSTFLGYLTGGAHIALFLILLAVWTFLAGLAWVAGPTVGIIASSNVAIMLVTVTLPTSVATAAEHAAVIASGGLVQAGMILLFPIRRWGRQRDALADALAAVADYARRLRYDPVAPFDPEPLMTARSAAAITAWEARRRPAELHGARGVAERIRPVLASLADPAVGAPSEGPERDRVRELLAAAGSALDSAARAIRHGEPVRLEPATLGLVSTPDTSSVLTGPARRAAARLVALLDDVVETAKGSGSETRAGIAPWPRRRPPENKVKAWPPRRRQAADVGVGVGVASDTASDRASDTASGVASDEAFDREALAQALAQSADKAPEAPAQETLHQDRSQRRQQAASHRDRPSLLRLVPVVLRSVRNELHHDSPILRHAIRVTAVTSVGYVLGAALPFGHGYWVPMTAVMTMRPDFSQTYGRAVARIGATLVGVALATGIVELAHPGREVLVLLAVLSAGLMYLLLRTGYAISQIFVAAYVVFLLGVAGMGVTQTVRERALLTLLGGLLAMIAYAVYPAWETPRLRARLADWLVADGRYAAAVVAHYAEPADRDSPDVREALLETREARVAWHEAEARAIHEPVRHRGLSLVAADDAEQALAQLSRVAMLMEAHLPERGTTPVPAAADLAEALRRATEQGAKDIQEGRVPQWGPVREALARWDGEGVPDQVVRSGAGLLLDALEELSEGLDEGLDEEQEAEGNEGRAEGWDEEWVERRDTI
ncbi:FUSC family protein [Streptomyces sp. NPDC088116]|uniref:FUSC family protein n=1 Tax=Streptomyces sp. NPDC088116 TaxID=3365825 RepID=UPI0037F6CA2B